MTAVQLAVAIRQSRLQMPLATFRSFDYVQTRDLAVKALRECLHAYNHGDWTQLELQLSAAEMVVERLDELGI